MFLLTFWLPLRRRTGPCLRANKKKGGIYSSGVRVTRDAALQASSSRGKVSPKTFGRICAGVYLVLNGLTEASICPWPLPPSGSLTLTPALHVAGGTPGPLAHPRGGFKGQGSQRGRKKSRDCFTSRGRRDSLSRVKGITGKLLRSRHHKKKKTHPDRLVLNDPTEKKR